MITNNEKDFLNKLLLTDKLVFVKLMEITHLLIQNNQKHKLLK